MAIGKDMVTVVVPTFNDRSICGFCEDTRMKKARATDFHPLSKLWSLLPLSHPRSNRLIYI